MSRSSSHALQANLTCAPAGFAAKLRAAFTDFTRFEPVAATIYAENANIRATGRNWLM